MKKKLLFVNDEMTLGGVSRILNTLLSKLDQDKYEIDLLVLNPHGELMDQIPKGINIIPSSPFFKYVDKDINSLVKSKNIFEIYKKTVFFLIMKTGLIKNRIIKERKKILTKHYDVEFAAKEGFCTIFTAFGNTPNKLNWVQTDYKENNYAKRHINLLKSALKKINMNIACSQQVADAFKEVFSIDNVIVIHNMISEEPIRKQSLVEVNIPKNDKVNVISVARFHPQKGVNRLINAIKYVKDSGVDILLTLIGDGLLMDDIKTQVNDLGLEKDVLFLGYQLNPYPYIRSNDLFVLSSHYEGYPTIVIESLICTTPVLAMEVAGVKNQITKEHYGAIIKNEQQALNKALLAYCLDRNRLQRYKQALASYHYDNEKILKELCYYINNKIERGH